MMAIDHRERCQAKHVYSGAERQCECRAVTRIRDRRNNDVYRACAKHARMALEGKMRPFFKVAPHNLRQHWRRTGQVPPFAERYEAHEEST